MGFNIPPVKITDSLDKANPGSIQPPDTSYRWKIAAMIIGAIMYLLVWFIIQKQIDAEIRLALDVRLLTLFKWVMNLVFVIAPFYLLFSIIGLIHANKKRLGLINVNDSQMTMKQLEEKNSLELAKLKMEVELMRATIQKYPTGVVSIQETDSHNGGSSTTNNNGAENTDDTTALAGLLELDPNDFKR